MSFGPDVEFPDVTNGIPCCQGYAHAGPGQCTCWRPMLEPTVQAPPVPADSVDFMPLGCGDCAYRADSRERRGDPTAGADEQELVALVETGNPFWCHDGMRQIVAYVHPNGFVLPISRDQAYVPEIHHGLPYRADGRPGAVCAGWATRRAALLKTEPDLLPYGGGLRSPDDDITAMAVHHALNARP